MLGDRIRVNSIHPGFIDTALTQDQDPAINANIIGLTPMKRAGTPLESRTVVFSLLHESCGRHNCLPQ